MLGFPSSVIECHSSNIHQRSENAPHWCISESITHRCRFLQLMTSDSVRPSSVQPVLSVSRMALTPSSCRPEFHEQSRTSRYSFRLSLYRHLYTDTGLSDPWRAAFLVPDWIKSSEVGTQSNLSVAVGERRSEMSSR